MIAKLRYDISLVYSPVCKNIYDTYFDINIKKYRTIQPQVVLSPDTPGTHPGFEFIKMNRTQDKKQSPGTDNNLTFVWTEL